MRPDRKILPLLLAWRRILRPIWPLLAIGFALGLFLAEAPARIHDTHEWVKRENDYQTWPWMAGVQAFAFRHTITQNQTSRIITPGTTPIGEWAATAQPDPVGTGTGSDENAIAHWDVVPYQTFDGLFNVGVLAFHMNDIARVDFMVNGGAARSIHAMSLNTQVANTSGVGVASSGVVEYWATLDASDFDDGQIEVRAIAYPTAGVPRVLESLRLNANATHTLPALSLYVATTGSDTEGDGTEANPYATIARAANHYSVTNAPIDNATIYVQPGTYKITAAVSNYPNTSTGFITVTTAPGVARSEVVIDGRDPLSQYTGLATQLQHYKNLTFAPATVEDQYLFLTSSGLGSTTLYWIDECNLIGPGRVTAGGWVIRTEHVYITGTSVSACRDSVSINSYLVRNVDVSDISQDAFSGAKCVIDSYVSGMDSTGTTNHGDVYQFFTGGPLMENIIIYGVTVRNGGASCGQGTFSGENVAIQDVAIVNCDMNNQIDPENPTVAAIYQFSGPTRHMLVKDCTYTGRAFYRTDKGYVPTNVVLENSTFSMGITTM